MDRVEIKALLEISKDKPDFWLTSFWGFNPGNWGYLGFSAAWMRSNFIKKSPKGAFVAVYVTKNKGPAEMRGWLVGIIQVTNAFGVAKDFVPSDAWARKEAEEGSRGRWDFALRVARAWEVIPEDRKTVEVLFPITYSEANSQVIGSQGMKLSENEVSGLLDLTCREIAIHGQTEKIYCALQTLRNALSPSKAVIPATEPYWVGEVDGPKHLYILRLSGDLSSYLGREASKVEGLHIVKVGFSKSPLDRCAQMQKAYPSGTFNWQVLLPKTIPEVAPYSCAELAIVGEDAMKELLFKVGAESLGGEFFLAEESMILRAWASGKHAVETARRGLV